ncbi:hypothetical protein [Marinobacter fuscus]|nr:hypothetical protein [Marinobacter fuscus]
MTRTPVLKIPRQTPPAGGGQKVTGFTYTEEGAVGCRYILELSINVRE